MLIYGVFSPVCKNRAAFFWNKSYQKQSRCYRSCWNPLDPAVICMKECKKKNKIKERFIGGALPLGAAQFIFELYLRISSVLKIKPRVRRCGSENFYLPFSFWVILVCSAETLCSCTPWPCLSLTGCSTSYTEESYCTVLKIAPPHTHCFQWRNAGTLLIGLLFLREKKRASIEEVNRAAPLRRWTLWSRSQTNAVEQRTNNREFATSKTISEVDLNKNKTLNLCFFFFLKKKEDSRN